MNIAFSTDNNYLQYCLIAICSICENNKGEELNFYILNKSLSDSNKCLLNDFIKKYEKVSVQYLQVQESDIKDLPIGRSDQINKYVSIETYFRLFLANLLPESVEKIIYLDCDIIVRKSLLDLWNVDLTGKAIAGITDSSTYKVSTYNRLRYNPKIGYFNGGVLVLNLKYWRENNCFNEFMDFIKNYPERIVWHDQDVLNYVLRNNKIHLSFEFNLQDELLNPEEETTMLYTDFEEMYKAGKDPVIIHYSSRRKPWFVECDSPYKNEYFKYRALTPFKNAQLLKRKLNKKEIIKKYLSFFKVCDVPPPIRPRKYNPEFVLK